MNQSVDFSSINCDSLFWFFDFLFWKVFIGAGIDYTKVECEGRVVPSDKSVQK